MKFCLVTHKDNIEETIEECNKNNGFCSKNKQNTLAHIANDSFYGNRDYMETEPTYKQIIPVFVLIDEDTGNQVVYKRKSNHTENRLAGAFTTLFGGHSEPMDYSTKMFNKENKLETVNGNIIPTTIANTVKREFEEETNLDFDVVPMSFEGFIYDKNNAVGAVHLGLCFFGYTKITDKVLNSIYSADEIDSCWLCSTNDIKEMVNDKDSGLESWARIVFDYIDKEFSDE